MKLLTNNNFRVNVGIDNLTIANYGRKNNGRRLPNTEIGSQIEINRHTLKLKSQIQ